MNKRDPATGKFIKRADGKIIKPEGWTPPDVKAEIQRQLRDGAWEGASPSQDALNVREFTAGAGQPTPERPCVMSEGEVLFLSKMMLDEIMELFATVLPPAQAKEALKDFVVQSKDIAKVEGDEATIISEQADALVDVYYYSLNAACKKGVNLSSIFSLVHQANMNKRDPATGQFIKREDGKIIKPKGWQPPDVDSEVERQMTKGSWNTSEDALSANTTPVKV